jgi:hypothetical protein
VLGEKSIGFDDLDEAKAWVECRVAAMVADEQKQKGVKD